MEDRFQRLGWSTSELVRRGVQHERRQEVVPGRREGREATTRSGVVKALVPRKISRIGWRQGSARPSS